MNNFNDNIYESHMMVNYAGFIQNQLKLEINNLNRELIKEKTDCTDLQLILNSLTDKLHYLGMVGLDVSSKMEILRDIEILQEEFQEQAHIIVNTAESCKEKYEFVDTLLKNLTTLSLFNAAIGLDYFPDMSEEELVQIVEEHGNDPEFNKNVLIIYDDNHNPHIFGKMFEEVIPEYGGE